MTMQKMTDYKFYNTKLITILFLLTLLHKKICSNNKLYMNNILINKYTLLKLFIFINIIITLYLNSLLLKNRNEMKKLINNLITN